MEQNAGVGQQKKEIPQERTVAVPVTMVYAVLAVLVFLALASGGLIARGIYLRSHVEDLEALASELRLSKIFTQAALSDCRLAKASPK